MGGGEVGGWVLRENGCSPASMALWGSQCRGLQKMGLREEEGGKVLVPTAGYVGRCSFVPLYADASASAALCGCLGWA